MKIRICDFCKKPLTSTGAIHTIKHKFYEEGFMDDTCYRGKLEICDVCWNEMSYYIINRLSNKEQEKEECDKE